MKIKLVLVLQLVSLSLFLFIGHYLPVFASETLLHEDFNDENVNDGNPADWNEIPNDGTWTTQSGKYVGTSSSGTKGPVSFVGDSSWSNYSVQVEVTGSVGVDRHILFRYDPTRAFEGYAVKYLEDSQGFSGNIILVKNKTGDLGVAGQVLATNQDFKSHVGETHTIKIDAINNHIKVYTDGTLRIDYIDSENPILSGGVGLFVQRSGVGLTNQTAYDNLIINTLDSMISQLPFTDDFGDSDYDNWRIISNSCKYNNQPAYWQVSNGELGIKINGGGCSTFLMPTSAPINPNSDYFVESDIRFTPSINMDRNLIVKFKDLSNWYGLHFVGSNVYLDKVVGGTEYFLPNKQFTYPFQNNQQYKVKTEVIGNQFKIYIDGVLVHTITDQNPVFPHTTAGLAASGGAILSSEVWFDNFKIEEINDNIVLNVPSLKQGDPPWGSVVYNNYPDVSTNQTIRKWGCYLTSASMVLQKNGFDISPLQLNTILKNNNGFTIDHGVDLAAVASYTQKLSDNNHLLYKWYDFNTAQLEAELNADRPPIVKLQGSSLPFGTHFVVVYGKKNGEYLIRDPEPTSSKTKLSDYSSDLYSGIRSLVPANTDFSYFNIYTSLNVTPKVFSSDGVQVTEYDYIEGPISADDGSSENSGEPLRVFSYPQALQDNYKVEFAGNGVYDADFRLYDQDGNLTEQKIDGLLASGQTDEVKVSFGQDNTTIAQITIDSTIADVDAAYATGMINKKFTYQTLKAGLFVAKDLYLLNKTILYKATLKLLLADVKKSTPKYITPEASEILQADLNYLIKN
jgi:hypothetical protein